VPERFIDGMASDYFRSLFAQWSNSSQSMNPKNLVNFIHSLFAERKAHDEAIFMPSDPQTQRPVALPGAKRN
jgi:hypothetical protein